MNRRNIASVLAGLVILILLSPAVIGNENDRWPQFRGPGARGVSDETGLPTTWSTTDNVTWVADIPGRGWSSPIVWGDTVFVTTVTSAEEIEAPKGGLYDDGQRLARDAEYRWVVYGLDVESGRVRWETEVHRGVPQNPRHLKNSYASETPVTDGNALYVSFGDLGMFALDMDGTVLWSHLNEVLSNRNGWGTGASPVLHDGRLYVVNDNDDQSYVAALSTESGAELWRQDRDEGTNWSTPFVWENDLRTELVTTGTDRVRSYGLDGTLLWELTGMSTLTVPTPFAEFGLLYISSGFVVDQARPVYAITPGASGDISLAESEASNEFIVWSRPQAAPYQPSPIIYGDYYYTLLDRGFFTCHDARTGEEIYGRQRIQTGAAFTASPWAYDDKIFAISEDGDTYVLTVGPTFEVVGRNSLDEFTLATPAIAHGSLFIRTASKLYRITDGAD